MNTYVKHQLTIFCDYIFVNILLLLLIFTDLFTVRNFLLWCSILHLSATQVTLLNLQRNYCSLCMSLVVGNCCLKVFSHLIWINLQRRESLLKWGKVWVPHTHIETSMILVFQVLFVSMGELSSKWNSCPCDVTSCRHNTRGMVI